MQGASPRAISRTGIWLIRFRIRADSPVFSAFAIHSPGTSADNSGAASNHAPAAPEVCMFVRWLVWVVMFHFLVLSVAFGEAESSAATYSSSAMPIEIVHPVRVPLERPRAQRIDFALYASIAVYRTMDYVSTRRALSAGGRETQLPQWVVDSPPTFVAFEGLATAVEAGTSLWLIRHGHRSVARTFNAVSISLGTNTVLHNYGVAAAQARSGGL
jgi:hypothetical protein